MAVAIPLVFVALGAVLIVTALRVARAERAFRAVAEETTGVVCGLHWHATADTGPLAYPELRFELPDGRAVEARSAWGARPAPARPGERVRVVYDPADPTRARLATSLGSSGLLWGILLVLGIGSVAFGLVGGVIAYLARAVL